MALSATALSGTAWLLRMRGVARRSASSQRALRVLVMANTPELCAHVESLAGRSDVLRAQGVRLELVRCAPTADGATQGSVEWRAALADAEVALAAPSALAPLLDGGAAPSLRWVQYTWAGVDAVFRDTARRDYLATRIAGVFGAQMAGYVLAHVLGCEKGVARAAALQREGRWEPQTWQAEAANRPLRTLTLGVLGAGSIGMEVAAAAAALGMRAIAFKRDTSAAAQAAAAAAGVHELTDSLPSLLRRADYIVNVLPSTAGTRGLLDGGALAHCVGEGGGGSAEGRAEEGARGAAPEGGRHRRAPVFINVGRGDVVSEASLLAALQAGHLSHAVLDVFPAEPLPAASALWAHPAVSVTPHVAAVSFPSDVAAVFVQNLERWVQGAPLHHVVDWDQGY